MKSTQFLLLSYSFITKISFVLKEVSFPDLNSYAASCFVFTICGHVPKHYNHFHWIQFYYIRKNPGKQAQRKQTKIGCLSQSVLLVYIPVLLQVTAMLQSHSGYKTIQLTLKFHRLSTCLLVTSTGVCIQSKIQTHWKYRRRKAYTSTMVLQPYRYLAKEMIAPRKITPALKMRVFISLFLKPENCGRRNSRGNWRLPHSLKTAVLLGTHKYYLGVFIKICLFSLYSHL